MLEDVYQPVADSIGNQLGCIVNAESLHHVGTMDCNGVDADSEYTGNFFI